MIMPKGVKIFFEVLYPRFSFILGFCDLNEVIFFRLHSFWIATRYRWKCLYKFFGISGSPMDIEKIL